ncbi:uncharacterized protein LOC126792137 [Argentina anserina]|uniref:uncharacterized protein LOC126792137 n=1 Tax=Argentina anserina TaxID=57926 RepID=UPI002176607F|nr:uncharacterized protein LOC126792137 [Potentilla anserina]
MLNYYCALGGNEWTKGAYGGGRGKGKRKMFVAERSLICNKLWSSLLVKKNGRESGTVLAKRRDLPTENSSTQEGEFVFPRLTVLARGVVAVLGLGFIDAGYSGDWSRIGVITKETEELIKVAAFIVVPLCLFLIFSISKQQED